MEKDFRLFLFNIDCIGVILKDYAIDNFLVDSTEVITGYLIFIWGVKSSLLTSQFQLCR